MQAVNLLPAYARPGSRFAGIGKDLAPSRVLVYGGAVAAVAALAVAGFYLRERSVVSDRKSELADVQSRVAAVEAIAAPIRAAGAEATARLSVVSTVDQTRVVWEKVMADMSRVLPSSAYLQSMQITGDASAASVAAGATAPAAPGTFTVSGIASSQNEVALVLDRFAELPWLTGITLGSVSRGGGAEGAASTDSFSITAGFSSAGGAK